MYESYSIGDPMKTDIDKIIKIAKKRGVVSSERLRRRNISPSLLCYMKDKNMLRRISRGKYVLPEYISSHETLVEVASKVTHGVICLLSALQFHELTSQMPYQVWIAIEKGSYYPRDLEDQVRLVQLSGVNFSSGIETYDENGIQIHVYSPAKTVADCFRFRNKIGVDIAIEALRDCIQQKKATSDEIWEHARRCHMTRIMRPYMETI
jgi:predicted transcriptional regulator of viral defense system